MQTGSDRKLSTRDAKKQLDASAHRDKHGDKNGGHGGDGGRPTMMPPRRGSVNAAPQLAGSVAERTHPHALPAETGGTQACRAGERWYLPSLGVPPADAGSTLSLTLLKKRPSSRPPPSVCISQLCALFQSGFQIARAKRKNTRIYRFHLAVDRKGRYETLERFSRSFQYLRKRYPMLRRRLRACIVHREASGRSTENPYWRKSNGVRVSREFREKRHAGSEVA